MALTNATLWDSIREFYPSFASHTAKATADLFTTRGWETLKRTDVSAIDEFFELSLRVALIDVQASRAQDAFDVAGFGESFAVPFGEIVQKMAILPFKPISAKYRGLRNGSSVDPFVVRKPATTERFFRQNFDYANMITLPDDFAKKVIFLSEYGMSEFTAGIMQQLQNGYTIQRFENKLEAISHALGTTGEYPLKDTQVMSVSLSAEPTTEELTEFVLALTNLKEAMMLPPQTDAYNAMSFPSVQDPGRLKLLIRPGYRNAIENINALNRPGLGLPFDVIVVPNFGGIEYYQDEAHTNKLYPHYDSMGAQDGWTATENGTDLYTDTVYTLDPHADVVALVADTGIIFEAVQNAYEVEPIRNPAGRYTNFWASSPGNTVAVDPMYNMVAIKNTNAGA